MRRLAVIALLCAVAASACGDNGPSRADLLGDYGTDVAATRYDEFARGADDLLGATMAMCETPSEDAVQSVRIMVGSLREEWLRLRAMATGPVMERRSEAVIDWPVRASDIEAFVEGAEPNSITSDVVAKNIGADSRGLSSMRYVLTADDSMQHVRDPKWCDYLVAVSEAAFEEANVVADTWAVLADQFSDDEAADSWLEMIVNDDINVVHKITEEPRDLGDAPPDVAADRAAVLEGVMEVWTALGPMLGDDLAERLLAQIEAARDAYSTDDIELGRELSREVEATLATEVAAHLDVTIGFSDADGDSAG